MVPVRLSTALASVEPHKGKEKGTSWLRPHSSFGEEPSLLTPVTPGGGGVTISASTAEFSLGSWLDGHSQGLWGTRGAGERGELAAGGRRQRTLDSGREDGGEENRQDLGLGGRRG